MHSNAASKQAPIIIKILGEASTGEPKPKMRATK